MTQHTFILVIAAATIFMWTTAPLRVAVAAGLLAVAFAGTWFGTVAEIVSRVVAVIAVLHAGWHMFHPVVFDLRRYLRSRRRRASL